MARAKQTNRAEARRRYRQTVAQSTTEGEELDEEASEAVSRASTPAPKGGAATSTQRPSIGGAFRAAYHAPHYREDLAALPSLVVMRTPARIPLTRTVIGVPWFAVSIVLVVVGFVAFAIYPTDGTYLLFQLLSLPPGGPTLPVLLVGFTAVRASYMLGFLVGLVDLVLVGIFAATIPTTQGSTVTVSDILTTAAVTGLPTSVLFAASAAWYRRFLYLSSVRRQQAQSASRSRSRRPANRR